ncbi:TetR/AcrR family transcriptional regulator [Microbacterium sp. No. 7]|uniref:TetR/AcrR family transcriptional regulator n=1 Tax=Microbacterium sp. No. 7 TaxID=1714373 RepID=UPI0006ED20F0|nr:TetR family transcriptional regulator [Microbacterium sp. No. 7]ALJ21558.1 hypothetical protein AOA12_17330 [Microbacterium sp. No. 7]
MAPLNKTQESILSAYAALVDELGTDDVSFRLIARRAGVGERTVFRAYATRVDLLMATAAWIEQMAFARRACASIFDAPLLIREAMHAYDDRPELAHLVAEASMRGVDGAEPAPRGALFDRLLREEIPSLDEAERRTIVAALSHLDSAVTWVSLRRELGMDRADIADAAAWAAEAVLDPVRDRTRRR